MLAAHIIFHRLTNWRRRRRRRKNHLCVAVSYCCTYIEPVTLYLGLTFTCARFAPTSNIWWFVFFHFHSLSSDYFSIVISRQLHTHISCAIGLFNRVKWKSAAKCGRQWKWDAWAREASFPYEECNQTKWTKREREARTPHHPIFDLQCVNAFFFLAHRYTIEYMVQIHFLFGHAFSSRLLLQWAKQSEKCMTNQRVYATAHGAQHTHTHSWTYASKMKKSGERAKKRLSSLKEARHTLRI